MIPGPVREGTARFHVFVERPRAAGPAAATALAQAIAARYGLPAADLAARIAAGRFRVKGNVDRATADAFAADLTQLGAVCSVVSAEATPVPAAAPTATPPVTLQQPRVAPPPRAAPLARATDDLGALSGEMPLTLATLDGADDHSGDRGASDAAMLPASFGPPPSSSGAMLPASFGPPAEARPLAAEPRPAAPAAVDMFAPPDAAAEAELALDVEPSRRRKRADSVPAEAEAAPVAPPTVAAAPASVVAEPPARPPVEPGLRGRLRDERLRFVAGTVLAAAIGFVPATVIASVREGSAFASLDGELGRRQDQLDDTRADWDTLDGVRASFAERKRAERHSIALTSLVIWAAASGGFAWFWFRKLDWDRVLGPAPR